MWSVYVWWSKILNSLVVSNSDKPREKPPNNFQEMRLGDSWGKHVDLKV